MLRRCRCRPAETHDIRALNVGYPLEHSAVGLTLEGDNAGVLGSVGAASPEHLPPQVRLTQHERLPHADELHRQLRRVPVGVTI
jgi:hypothetical protein